jgi:hypothetical protein
MVTMVADGVNWTLIKTHICSATVPTFADQ